MESAPSANQRRDPPPFPPNYVSLRQLQELRLKEKEEQERRRREEEEAEKAAAAARREAEKAAAAARREAEKAAAARREAEKAAASRRGAETNGRATSWEASGGAMERARGEQEQENQRVAVAHRAPATAPRPMARGQGAAGKREAAIRGGRGDKGPDDVADSAPHGGRKGWCKRKGKGKLAEPAPASSHGKPAEVVPASSHGGKPEKKIESKAKGKVPGDGTEESSSRGGPGEEAEAPIVSSRDCSRPRKPTGAGGAGGRNAETCAGIAPVKTAAPSPPRGVRSDDTGKPKPSAPRRANAVAGSESPEEKKTAPAQAPPTSAADGSSKPTGGGELRRNVEAKPGGVVEGHRRRPVVDAQAVAELNPRVGRCSSGPWRGRGNEAAEQHGRVWVPKKAAAGSSAGAGI